MIPKSTATVARTARPTARRGWPEELHPAWRALIALCQSMRYGHIERIKVQDGIPVLVETVTTKVKLV